MKPRERERERERENEMERGNDSFKCMGGRVMKENVDRKAK